MHLKFWIILPFMISFVCAGGARDFRYAVQDNQFLPDAKVLNAENTCVDGGDSTHLRSEKIKLPLASGKLYLRSKIKGNSYAWFAGASKADCFRNLYAFGLQENHLTAFEALHLRFYSKAYAKAYQDEGEVYFDRGTIYSTRVPELFFFLNGKWQKLKRTTLFGIVTVKDMPKDTRVVIGQNSYPAPLTFSPADTGLFVATLSAPGFYPFTAGLKVSSGKTSYLKWQPIALDTVVYEIQTSVTAEQIAATKNLQETEILYDTFIEDLNKNSIERGFAGFDSIYPSPKNPPRGLSKDDKQYREYLSEFEKTRARARAMWLESRLSKILALNSALLSRLEVQQKDTLHLTLSASTAKWDGKIAGLYFKDPGTRVEVAWAGFFAAAPESLIVSQARTQQMQFVINVENKPVWLYDGFRVKSRHQYRFLGLKALFGGKELAGEGTFILSPEISAEPEVEEWLALQSQPPAPKDSLPPADTVKPAADTVVKISDPSRETVEIDSGSFRFRNKIVQVKAFAIRKTEVTVGEYREVMKDSTKFTFGDSLMPAHNVSWEKASTFCQTIGGNLPTEAEWEYAARAGTNEGSIWRLKTGAQAFEFAVFREKAPKRVASTKPNPWGLYDVSGNVAEWTLDSPFWTHGRIFKGGSWKSWSEDELDLTDRDDEDPRYWSNTLGFRCVFPPHRKGNP